MCNSQEDNIHLGCKVTKRLLGQILADGEFISSAALERALKQQEHTNKLLGEILVHMGVLAPVDLKAVLSVNRDLASLEGAVKVAAGVRRLLGELLLQARRITPQQLELALIEQQRTGEKLGEVLVRLGLITRSELGAVLTFQQCQSKAPTPGRLRLGEILVATNQISRDQLEDALSRQRLSQKKIGEVLVEAGYVQPHQVTHGLKLQHKLLTAAIVAVLSLAPLSNIQSAGSISQDATNNSRITMDAAAQTSTAMKVVYQPSEVVVTHADILRGYVDIPTATHVEIRNENLAGYLLAFKGLGEPFKEVLVKGLGEEVQISSNGGWITQPYTGRDPIVVTLSFRFILSENARPGTYAWPLKISASPILPA